MNNQKTFDFLPETERNKHIAAYSWTKLSPGQEVNTIHTESWYEEDRSFWGGGIGDDDTPQIRHERKVEKHWHVYLLPVLVNDYGNYFALPDMFEVINGVNGPIKFEKT